jgi:CRP/FNR family transcriptional regulator
MDIDRNAQEICCSTCAVRSLCIGKNQSLKDIQEFNLIRTNKKLKKRQHICHALWPMKNLYAVHTGSCKEYWIDIHGNEHITNFHLPGDIIGIESIPDQKHRYSVSALEPTILCIIPLTKLFKLMKKNHHIMQRFITISSNKMQHDQATRMSPTASGRVSDFILTIFWRMHERHTEGKINLPMSQQEISNYLGIAYETVNRIFNHLKLKKIITLENRTLEILDHLKLKKLGVSEYFFNSEFKVSS